MAEPREETEPRIEAKRKSAFRFRLSSDVDLLKEVMHVQPFDCPHGQTKSRWGGGGMRGIHGDGVTALGCRKRLTI